MLGRRSEHLRNFCDVKDTEFQRKCIFSLESEVHAAVLQATRENMARALRHKPVFLLTSTNLAWRFRLLQKGAFCADHSGQCQEVPTHFHLLTQLSQTLISMALSYLESDSGNSREAFIQEAGSPSSKDGSYLANKVFLTTEIIRAKEK